MLSTMAGLGSHFATGHRGACFNDNLDGTLTQVGAYADPKSAGRTTSERKPAIIVSKRRTSLAESPMVPPISKDDHRRVVKRGLAYPGTQAGGDSEYEAVGGVAHATQPTGRATVAALLRSPARDGDEDEGVGSGMARYGTPGSDSETDKKPLVFRMAARYREYNMWPGKSRCGASLGLTCMC